MGLVKMAWGAPFPPPQILKHQHLIGVDTDTWVTCRLQAKPTASPLERFDDTVRNPVRQRISFSGSRWLPIREPLPLRSAGFASLISWSDLLLPRQSCANLLFPDSDHLLRDNEMT